MAAIEQTEGGVYTWGKGSYGCLGTGTDFKQLEPKKVVLEVTLSGRTKGHFTGASYIDCGYCTTAAVVNDGELWVWGAGSDGRLGLGDLQGRVWVPERVEKQSNGEPMPKMKQVSMGSWHCGAVSQEGDLFMWGRGEWGNLGVGKRCGVVYSPTPIEGELKGRQVKMVHCNHGQINPIKGPGCDGLHTTAVTERGELYIWGTGHKGQCGNLWKKWTNKLKGKEDELLPYHVGDAPKDMKPQGDGKVRDSRYLYGEPMFKACAGTAHTAVLSAGGRAYSFGCGDEGRLGVRGFLAGAPGSGSTQVNKFFVSQPTLLEELWECGVHVKDIATSQKHMAAVAL